MSSPCWAEEENTPEACDDDLDNDGDGVRDCSDLDCREMEKCLPVEEQPVVQVCEEDTGSVELLKYVRIASIMQGVGAGLLGSGLLVGLSGLLILAVTPDNKIGAIMAWSAGTVLVVMGFSLLSAGIVKYSKVRKKKKSSIVLSLAPLNGGIMTSVGGRF